jgi:hypothetical protein
MATVIQSRDSATIKSVDKGIKNKFKWGWLDEEIEISSAEGKKITIKIGDTIQKLNTPGQAWCLLCSSTIAYGGRGKFIRSSILSLIIYFCCVVSSKDNNICKLGQS